jgi:hypothetical protein
MWWLRGGKVELGAGMDTVMNRGALGAFYRVEGGKGSGAGQCSR